MSYSFADSYIPTTMAKRSSDIPMKLEKLKPKPGQLRRYSTSNTTIRLSESARNSPLKMDNNKPKPNPVRRYSTGNSMGQISESNIPNYLKSSSIYSCHDFCKYGKKHDSKAILKPPRITTKKDDQNAAKEERSSLSDKSCRGKKINSSVSSELKPKPKLKPKPLAANHGLIHQSSAAEKQPKKPFLKSSNNVRVNQKDARKGKSSKLLPNSNLSTSVKVPSPKSSPKKFSNLETENCVEKSGSDKTSHVGNENVPHEKIIHVIEATGDDERRIGSADVVTLSPVPNQDQEMDSTVGKEEENDSSPGSVEYTAEEAVRFENGDENGGPVMKDFGSDEEITSHEKNDGEAVGVDDGEINFGATAKDLDSDEEIMIRERKDDLRPQAEETECGNLMIEEAARKLIDIRKNKVMDLVAAFERLIHNQDSESIVTTIS